MPMTLTLRPTLLVLLSTVALACKSKPDEAAADVRETGEASKPTSDTGEPPAEPGAEVDDPRALALPIPQAKTAASVTTAKGAKAMPGSLAKIQHLYALTATAKQPEWGAAGTGEPKLSRDDDLDSAWTCTFGQATSCVLGFALPEPAKVEILRIYGAGGPRFRDYNGHPRLAKVRIHTDVGFFEVELPDGASHTYVLFAAPVETQTVAIEVLGVHKGKDALAHFAEVEIYGSDGAPRTPIVLDPAQAFVSWETTAWDGGKAGKHTIRQAFVGFLRGDGIATAGDPAVRPASRRFTRATAVYGKDDDDYLLFERMFGTDCVDIEGSYLLFDRRNRMFYPLTDLGGAGAPVYRHRDGRGFAAGWIDGERFTVKGIVEEAGELKWKRPPKQAPEDPLALLSEWGFETSPIGNGGSLAAPPAGCKPADAAGIDRMISAAKLPLGGEIDPAQWLSCSVGTDTLFVSAPCNAPAQAYSIDASNGLVGKFASKQAEARGFRLRRTGLGEALLVELSSELGASSILYWVNQGAFAQVEKAGALEVRPPATCLPCTDEWGASADEGGETGETETGADTEMLDGPMTDEGEIDEGEPDEGADEDPDAFLVDEGGDEEDEGELPNVDPPLPGPPPMPGG